MKMWEADGRVRVVGHRGAPALAPENTLASFAKALEMGVDFVEVDVHLSRDGALVVIHDHTLDRTTDGRGLVGQRSLEEIKRLDAGSWFDRRFAGERIPTLDEVLELVGGRCAVAVEIKNGPIFYEGIEGAVLASLERHGALGRAMVMSFDHPTALRFKELAPESHTGVLFAGTPVVPVALAKEARADMLMPLWTSVSAEMVASAHQAGLGVVPWPVDEPAAMEQMIAAGVDAIATNHPDRLRAMLD
ncbi:MAG: glycerophosphodiester phosphodiesterase family protein [Dehalococcoidia bacterium]